MIAFHDWLARLAAKSSARPSTTRRAQLDWLERRQLLTTSEPIDTSVAPVDENLQTVIVVASTEPEILESPPADLPMGPLPLEDAGSGEGYGWVQGTGAGTGYVPGSVLASADSIQWGDNTIEDWDETGDGYSEMDGFASGSSELSGSGSGGTSESGSGGSSASGSGSSSGSGSGGSSGSGIGSSSGSGSGGSGSGGGDTAPVIHNFDWTMGNGYYTFSGSVADDEEVSGLTIIFGGLLQGEFASVQQDGTFSFSINLENPIGEVTSIVQDYDELWSEEEIVYV
jgi:hypothetical protein